MVSGILVRIGIGIIAATVLAAVIGLFLPSTFEIEKSVVIKAEPGTDPPVHRGPYNVARMDPLAEGGS